MRGHCLGLVAAEHDLDVRVEARGDGGADLVGRGKKVEPGPAGRGLVHQPYRVGDAQAAGFGVQDADVVSGVGGIGGDVGHAEHREGEVVNARPDGIVAQRGVDEHGVQRAGRVSAGDQTVWVRCLSVHICLPKQGSGG
jgi:hypothetical protein